MPCAMPTRRTSCACASSSRASAKCATKTVARTWKSSTKTPARREVMSTAVNTIQSMNTKPLFKLMVEKKASDLFFTSYAPVKIKIDGKIFPVNKQILSPETVRQAAIGLMTKEQLEHFNQELDV